MYKDKAKQQEANRLANQKLRDKQKGITQGITKVAEKVGITISPTEDFAPIIYALANPLKREKLQKICFALSGKATHHKNYLPKVWFGIGYKPVLMSQVAELLDCLA